jgi:hypothetical protein
MSNNTLLGITITMTLWTSGVAGVRSVALGGSQRAGVSGGDLRAAAALSGSIIVNSPAVDSLNVSSLKELVALSEVVIVGKVTGNVARLSSDGLGIFGYYTVSVERVISASESIQNVITVAMPGGRVGFPDGTWAQVNAPGSRWPLTGHEYMFFLANPPDDIPELGNGPSRRSLYALVDGPLSVYELKGDGSNVQSNGLVRSRLAQSIVHAELSSTAFESMVRAFVR